MTGSMVRRPGYFVALGAALGLAALAAWLWVAAAAAADGAPGSAVGVATVAGMTAAACSAHEHREFDFWLGHWEVTEAGKPAGSSRIEPLFDGCALHETWLGAGGMRGESFNIYDGARGVWHQSWIDDHGSLLLLEGGLRDGAMVLEGDRPARSEEAGRGTTVRHRITWTPLPGGEVRQHWQTSRDGGRTWETAFDGLYRRAR